MKQFSRILVPMLVLATLLISACAGAPAQVSDSSGAKVQAAPVEFTGVIESITGNQWVINGQTIMADPAVVRDGSFKVGDTVKVGAEVAEDGTIVMKSVTSSLTDTNSNDANGNDANGNDANGNDANGNDVNGNDANGNDVNGNDANGNDVNGNDDNGNDTNSNDDNGNDDNSNDDNGNDDNSNDVNSNDANSKDTNTND